MVLGYYCGKGLIIPQCTEGVCWAFVIEKDSIHGDLMMLRHLAIYGLSGENVSITSS